METKRRNLLWTVLLSIITPGLGQVYNGQLTKGIVFYIGSFLLVMLFSLTGLQYQFKGIILLTGISLSFWLYIIADALVTAKKKKEIVLNSYNKWYFYLIIIILSAIIFSFTDSSRKNLHGIKSYKIPSGAMMPTLQVGDHIMVDLKYYKANRPKRGDVIVFKFPKDERKDFIKRVIGLPGDTIKIIDKKIYINDELLWEPYSKHIDPKIYPAGIQPRDNFGPVVVPDDSYIVLGDNRDYSLDSRYWGFVNINKIKGKALYIYWAWDGVNNWMELERVGVQIK